MNNHAATWAGQGQHLTRQQLTMGKKRRGHPDVEEILARPWCYYCERDFEDLKLLILHQKAKHFKCDRCGRRLNTAGGLSVHLNQVHKETLSQVENALPNRQGLEVEIFGMEGIPQDILDQHRNRIIQNFYQAQEDRRIATGNPLPGHAPKDSRKKIKIESAEEILARLAEFRAQKKAGITPGGAMEGVVSNNAPPAGRYDAQQFQQGYGQPSYGFAPDSLPSRPSSNTPNASALPQRPTQGGAWNGQDGTAAGGDEIDQMIRMAEAGIKAKRPEDEDAAAGDKKAKKDKEKKGRMIYDDAEISPEERMSAMPRYAFRPEVEA
ncbi:BUB3-interacting and GLEBS motif-containing protein [Paramyrothecium foliicola]|nr:BUB3-interacting and GLEBS motif-containing protein [Paramyrothecium foliicola]